MTAELVSRQVAVMGRMAAAALRSLMDCRWTRLDPRRFACCAEIRVDETCAPQEDQFLCVSMSGRIVAPQDGCDTDLAVELLDITDGTACPEAVLSISPDWHGGQSPVFYYSVHNGVIPHRDAVLARPVQAARIPLHLLRFARRGRRRIQVTVAILNKADRRLLARAGDTVEYVVYSDGFLDLQERREKALYACVELACAAVAEAPFEPALTGVIERWIQDKTRHFKPRRPLAEPLSRLQNGTASAAIEPACEGLLAWGQRSDRFAAMDLALQAVAVCPSLTSVQEIRLRAMAAAMHLSDEHFLALCQKRLLTENCPYDRWRLLLGVGGEMLSEEFRRRLNEEYRKWNARVTHTNPHIRRQADTILSLIAEVRSRQNKTAVRV